MDNARSIAIIRRVILQSSHVASCPGESSGLACTCGILAAMQHLRELAATLSVDWPAHVETISARHCLNCRAPETLAGEDGLSLCAGCRARIPYRLVKAAAVKGSYALVLDPGGIVAFTSLSFSSIVGWVTLHEPGGTVVEVMLSRIVMVSDDSEWAPPAGGPPLTIAPLTGLGGFGGV